MRGKYSPTVNAAYRKDQEWFTKFAATKQVTNRDFWTQYDPEGYDSYGYDENEVDRAGNEEHVYYEDDEFGENWRYNQALNDWRFDGTKPVRN
jgi:hypothetical protein